MTSKYTHGYSPIIAHERTSGPYKLTVRLRLVRELFADVWSAAILFADHSGARLAIEQLAQDIGLPTNDDEVGDE